MSSIVLKNLGKIGGDDAKVRSRITHILACIDKGIDFSVTEVRVRGSSSLPPIYEAILDDPDSAAVLRRAFSRFTQKRNPSKRPPELEGVGVFNSVTIATRVRLSILRVSVLFFI